MQKNKEIVTNLWVNLTILHSESGSKNVTISSKCIFINLWVIYNVPKRSWLNEANKSSPQIHCQMITKTNNKPLCPQQPLWPFGAEHVGRRCLKEVSFWDKPEKATRDRKYIKSRNVNVTWAQNILKHGLYPQKPHSSFTSAKIENFTFQQIRIKNKLVD